MALTKTATAAAGGASPKTSPDSITTVSYFNRAQSVSGWTTSAPQVLYTAPSNCKYARIVIPDKGKQSSQSYTNESFRLESTGSHNHWYSIGIVNDANNTEDEIARTYSANTSFDLQFNSHSQASQGGQYNYNTSHNRGPFDVIAVWRSSNNYYNYVTIHSDRFILNPGEKFVAMTGNNSNNGYIYANFQAWVYN